MNLLPLFILVAEFLNLSMPLLAADPTNTAPPTPLMVLTGTDCEENLVTNPAEGHLKLVEFNGETFLNYSDHRVAHLVSLHEALLAFPKFLAFLRRPLLQSIERVSRVAPSGEKRAAFLRLWPLLEHLEKAIADSTVTVTFSNSDFNKPLKINFSDESSSQIRDLELSHSGMVLLLEILNHDLNHNSQNENLVLLADAEAPISTEVIDQPLKGASLILGAAVTGILAQIDLIGQNTSEPSVFDLKVAENQASAIFEHGFSAVAVDPSAELWPVVKSKIQHNDISSLAKAFAPGLQRQLRENGGGDGIFAIRRRRQRLDEYKTMEEQSFLSFSFKLAKAEALEGRRALAFKELGHAAAFYEFALEYFSGTRDDFRFLNEGQATRALQYSKVNFEYICEILRSVLETNQ